MSAPTKPVSLKDLLETADAIFFHTSPTGQECARRLKALDAWQDGLGVQGPSMSFADGYLRAMKHVRLLLNGEEVPK